MKQPLHTDTHRVLASMNNDKTGGEQDTSQTPPMKEYDVYIESDRITFIRKTEPAENTDTTTAGEAEAIPTTEKAIADQPLLSERESTLLARCTVSFAVLLILSTLLIQVNLILHPLTATIVIIPKSRQIPLHGTLQLGRVVSLLTISQSVTVPATGKGHQDAKQAQGSITFYNGELQTVTVPAGTILTGVSSIQIVTDQDAAIPALDATANPPMLGQVTVSAHAVNSGARGNIPAYDINQPCCFRSVIAKNTSQFQGGQDERDFRIVTKQDISSAAATLKTTVAQSMQGAFQGQLKNGETLVTSTCTPVTTADHREGAEAIQVTIRVSETCSAVVYANQELEEKVTKLLTIQAYKTLGAEYILLGNPQVLVTQATATNQTKKAVASFTAVGTWVYALHETAQQRIKHLIIGKTKQEALQILHSLPGIQSVSLAGVDDMTKLPKDPRNIHIVILYTS